MREELLTSGVQDTVVDDAVLVLSELLSNACRHARPIHGDGLPGAPEASVRAAWRIDGEGRLIIAVTDGGGPTRPAPATPSVTARGGRGLAIIRSLAKDWGVRDSAPGEVTVWAALSLQGAFATRVDLAADLTADLVTDPPAGLPPVPRKPPRATAVRRPRGGPGRPRGAAGSLALAELGEMS